MGHRETKTGTMKHRKSLCAIFIIGLIGQILMIVLFLLGTSSVFGAAMGPFQALNEIVRIFSCNPSNIYRYVVGLLFGAGYFVLLILMLRVSIADLIICGKKFHAATDEFVNFTRLFVDDALGIFYMQIVFASLAVLFTGSGYNLLFAVGMFFSAFLLILQSITPLLAGNRAAKSQYVWNALKSALAFTMVYLLLDLFRDSYGLDAFHGLKMLFRGYVTSEGGLREYLYILYTSVLEKVLLIILFIVVLRIIFRLFLYSELDRSKIKRMLIYSCVLSVALLLFRIFLSADMSELSISLFGEWFYALRTLLLPVCLLSIGLFVLQASSYREGDRALT